MITFDSINVPMPDIDQSGIRQWIEAVAETYHRRVGNISYVFADDEEILRVNRQFLGHDFYTDIIISLDTVATNA